MIIVCIYNKYQMKLMTMGRTYNDKAYTSPQLFGYFFNFRIFINFFHSWSKETVKVLGIGAVFT